LEKTLVVPINDERALERALQNRDIALVMVEAAGAFTGVTGIAPDFYHVMRKLTSDAGTLLHFDEVVTGFRYSPGGVQAVMGVTPDLTSLGKIITGGMPGAGAIVGRADILDLFSFKDEHWNRYNRVAHSGTFNGNPLCASTGIATLKILADGKPQQHAAEMAQTLRDRMQAAISKRDLSGCVFGDSSVYHIYLGTCEIRDRCNRRICLNDAKTISVPLGHLLAMNFMLNGVHGPARGYDGLVSTVHDKSDIQITLQAFEASLDALINERTIEPETI
jgi:glutamate-1-semialdehyde 2,1-aminomutase